MKFRLLLWLSPCVLSAALIPEVRQAIAAGDFAGAEKRIETHRAASGVTSEMLEAMSWLGRGALAAKQYDKAESYAAATEKLVLEQLKTRRLDADKNTPIALGAAIEVQAQVLAARGERSAAVSYLNRELKGWHATSIRARIQKNLNLLTLEGKPAPALGVSEWLGPKPLPLASYRGRPVLLFLWAHWCGDCKREVPILARIASEHPKLVLIGPTQRYGYVARGEDATPAAELAYIEKVRREHYSELSSMPAPVSPETFKNYGASTTPTLVLIDAGGIVRMYHPGAMTYEELSARLRSL